MADAFAVAATTIGAFVGGGAGAAATVLTGRSRERGATREEWFRRLTWASDLTFAGDEQSRHAGVALLRLLSRDRFVTDMDRDLGETLLSMVGEFGGPRYPLAGMDADDTTLLTGSVEPRDWYETPILQDDDGDTRTGEET